MARRRKIDSKDQERIKKRSRSFRSRERRKQRTTADHDPSDLGWLKLSGIRMAACKVMNDSYRQPAPFWLSIPAVPRPEPVDFFPCRSFQRGDRIWYGFLFREHRDQQIVIWGGRARKELTQNAQGR